MRLIALVLVLLAGAARADSITLRSVARVDATGPVLLVDVADLAGPAVVDLHRVIIVASGERAGRDSVDLAEVRRALEALKGDQRINWGLVTLSGAQCRLVCTEPEVREAAPAAAPVPQAGTVRQVVEERLAQMLAAAPADLRVTLDEADAQVLNLPTAGRVVDVRAVGTSGRMPLAVTVYEGDRIVAARTIRAEVQVRRTVLLAAVPRRRGELIGPDDVTLAQQWLSPGARPAAEADVIGAAVRSRLDPGQLIGPEDIEPPVTVRKGEIVAVHCVVGSVVLRTTARAMAEGRDGQIVKMESLSEPPREFFARMDGRGRAVAVGQ